MKVGEGFIKDRLVTRDRQVDADRCHRRDTFTAANSSSRLRIVSLDPCLVSRRLEVVSSRPGIVSGRLVSRRRHVNKFLDSALLPQLFQRPPSLKNTAPVRVAIRGVWRYVVTRGPRRISRGRKDQHAPSPTSCRRCRLSV
ncbi:hypothetical protein Bbelb_370920 [Branchiostoma belcheri]|nr:hypothetical protein Bbelb_370920 [Branchiostoma belcheri]